MDAVAIALVLGSAGLHAWWNMLHHRSEDRLATIAFAYTIGGIALLPAAFIDPPTQALVWLTLSIPFHAGYQWLLSGAFARGGLSVTYPIARGVSPLLVGVGGWVLLGQKPSWPTVAGIALISSGLLALVSLGKQLMQLTGVGFAALTGVTIAGYSLVDAHAVSLAGPVGYFSVTALFAGSLMLAIGRVGPQRLAAVWKLGSVIGSAQAGGYVLILFAFQRAQAAQVASLRQLSVVIGVLIAGEVARRKAFLSASLIAMGAVLLAT